MFLKEGGYHEGGWKKKGSLSPPKQTHFKNGLKPCYYLVVRHIVRYVSDVRNVRDIW